MNDMASQFTPAQILDAAQRAEGDGQFEYALKYYRHLFEVYRSTPEGVLAGEAINRLASWYGDGGSSLSGGSVAGNFQHSGQRPAGPSSRMQGQRLGGQTARRRPKSSWRQSGAGGYPFREAARGYFAGRLLAMLVTWGGVIGSLLGAGVIGSIMANVSVLIDLLGIVPGFGGMKSGALLLGGGLAMIFVGQFARAVFDLANATREIADLEQYRAEQDSGVGEPY